MAVTFDLNFTYNGVTYHAPASVPPVLTVPPSAIVTLHANLRNTGEAVDIAFLTASPFPVNGIPFEGYSFPGHVDAREFVQNASIGGPMSFQTPAEGQSVNIRLLASAYNGLQQVYQGFLDFGLRAGVPVPVPASSQIPWIPLILGGGLLVLWAAGKEYEYSES